MTEEQAKTAFLEKSAVTYTASDRDAEIYEHIYALRYVRQGDKVGVFAELNGRQLIRDDGTHPNCVMTVPIRYISINGAVEIKKKSKKAVMRHKYGEYKNVLLSDEELDKLKAEFPNDWKERIEAVDSWVQQKGKGYDNYLATIRNWARREKAKSGAETVKSGAYPAKKSRFNNYTDTNKPDYSNFGEQILNDLLNEER